MTADEYTAMMAARNALVDTIEAEIEPILNFADICRRMGWRKLLIGHQGAVYGDPDLRSNVWIEKWPDIGKIQQMIERFHRKDQELRHAWNALPNRTGLVPPWA